VLYLKCFLIEFRFVEIQILKHFEIALYTYIMRSIGVTCLEESSNTDKQCCVSSSEFSLLTSDLGARGTFKTMAPKMSFIMPVMTSRAIHGRISKQLSVSSLNAFKYRILICLANVDLPVSAAPVLFDSKQVPS